MILGSSILQVASFSNLAPDTCQLPPSAKNYVIYAISICLDSDLILT
jgi:hypothetical protein